MKKLLAIVASALTLGAFATAADPVITADTSAVEPGTTCTVMADNEELFDFTANGGEVTMELDEINVGKRICLMANGEEITDSTTANMGAANLKLAALKLAGEVGDTVTWSNLNSDITGGNVAYAGAADVKLCLRPTDAAPVNSKVKLTKFIVADRPTTDKQYTPCYKLTIDDTDYFTAERVAGDEVVINSAAAEESQLKRNTSIYTFAEGEEPTLVVGQVYTLYTCNADHTAQVNPRAGATCGKVGAPATVGILWWDSAQLINPGWSILGEIYGKVAELPSRNPIAYEYDVSASTWDPSDPTEFMLGDSVSFVGSGEIELPANLPSSISIGEEVTLAMTPAQSAALTTIAGAGTLKVSNVNTGTSSNQHPTAAAFAGFTGTYEIAAGRIEATSNFSHANMTIKVDDGAQLSTSTGDWAAKFVLAGQGWTKETELNRYPVTKAALRIGGNITGAITLVEGDAPVALGTYSGEHTVSGVVTSTTGIKIIGDGSGKIVLSAANSITGDSIVTHGTLKMGATQALGAQGNNVTVSSGATIDFNGVANSGLNVTLEGGTVANTGTSITSSSVQMRSLTLKADSTINCVGDYGILNNNWNAATLTLNGHKLTKTGNGNLWLCHVTSDAGTIDVQGGTFYTWYPMNMGATDVILGEGTRIRSDSDLTLNSVTLNGGTIKLRNDATAKTFKINSKLVNNSGSIEWTMVLADGATIDIPTAPESGDAIVTSTQAITLEGDLKLSIAGEETTDYTLSLGEEAKSIVATAAASEIPGEELIDNEEKDAYKSWAETNGVTAETTTDHDTLAIAFHLDANKGETYETIEDAAQAKVKELLTDIDLSALADPEGGEEDALTALNTALEEKGLVASLKTVTLEGASESTKLYKLVITLKTEN